MQPLDLFETKDKKIADSRLSFSIQRERENKYNITYFQPYPLVLPFFPAQTGHKIGRPLWPAGTELGPNLGHTVDYPDPASIDGLHLRLDLCADHKIQI